MALLKVIEETLRKALAGQDAFAGEDAGEHAADQDG